MKCSLLISTYNWHEALELCLKSVRQQKVLPDEIIIADDGSAQETAALIKTIQKNFPVQIKHIWHRDEGFRLAAIRNKAIAASSGKYIVQIDGDLILDPYFIADHLQFKKPGYFVTGSRVLLSASGTNKLIKENSVDLKKYGGEKINPLNGVRSRLVRNLLAERYKTTGKYQFYVKGCNMAFWKKDLIAVNGYNESFIGWGPEDSEIAIRLMNTGIKKQFIKMGAICYHLYHKDSSREMMQANKALMQKAIEEKCVFTAHGLDQYLNKKIL